MNESQIEPIDRASVLAELELVLAHPVFKRAERSSTLLRFLVVQTLDGHADRLKEYTLGSEALARGEAFDPRIDPVVRAEASRLRGRLEQYYESVGQSDSVVISLAKGSYVPQFARRTAAMTSGLLAPSAAAMPESKRLPRVAALAGAAICGALIASVWFLSRSTPPGELPALRFEVELNSDGALASDVGTTTVLSQDGTRMVFVSRDPDGRTHLNLRQLDQPAAVALAGTEGARGPFLSPSGRWVGFWADGKLKKMSLDGGAPMVLCDAADLLGASWGVEDTIIAALGAPGKLSRVSVDGGEPSVALDLGQTVVRWPQLLDDGDTVIYTAFGADGADRASIEAQSLRSGQRKVLVRGGTFGRYQSDGYLAYVNQGTLYAVRMDPSTLSVSGAPVPIFDDVAYSSLFGYAQFDLARNGMLVYRRGVENQRTVVSWLNDGKPVLPAGRYNWIRVAPDGRRAAVTTQDGGVSAISIYDLTTRERAGATSKPGQYTGLTWLSRDVVVFGGSNGLGWVRADKPEEVARLLDSRNAQTPWSVSPDGRRLAYYERSADTGFDLWTVALDWTNGRPTAGQPEPYLRTRAFEVYPSFSPDGRWIAYASNESGPWEIYVRRFPDDGTKVRVSTAGGVVPAWSSSGELVFRTSAQQLMIAPYKTGGGSIAVELPKPLSQERLADTGVLPNFDVGFQGKAVVLKSASVADQQSPNHVTLVTSFISEVRRRPQAQ